MYNRHNGTYYRNECPLTHTPKSPWKKCERCGGCWDTGCMDNCPECAIDFPLKMREGMHNAITWIYWED